jgi:hypothetical protein
VVAVLPTSAVLDPNLTDGAVRVLAALSAHGSWDYLWDHSARGISNETAISVRMINRYRQELLERGYVDEDGRLISLADASWTGFEHSNRGAHLAPKVKPVKAKVGVTEIDDAKFEEFWVLYPRKEGRGSARKAWAKAIGVIKKTEDDPERYLKEVTARYRSHVDDRPSRERKFIPHAATWLNAEHWTDEFLHRPEADLSGSLAPQTL